MIKEIIQEFKFLYENPIAILILLTITGIIPSLICGLLINIFGL